MKSINRHDNSIWWYLFADSLVKLICWLWWYLFADSIWWYLFADCGDTYLLTIFGDTYLLTLFGDTYLLTIFGDTYLMTTIFGDIQSAGLSLKMQPRLLLLPISSHGLTTATFGIHSHKTWDTAQPCHLLKPNWKPSSSHSISAPAFINTQCLY